MLRINLTPRELQTTSKTAAFDKRLIYLVLIGVLAIAGMIGGTTLQTTKLASINRDIENANAELAQLQTVVKTVENINNLRKNIQERKNAIEALDKQRAFQVDLLSEYAFILPDYLWTKDYIEELDPAGATRVRIEGYAFSIRAVETLLLNLFKSKYYTNVSLQFIKQEVIDGAKLYFFHIEAGLNKDASKPGTAVVAAAGPTGGPAAGGGKEEQGGAANAPSGLVAKGKEALQMDPNAGKQAMSALR